MHYKNRKPKSQRGCCSTCSRAERVIGHPTPASARAAISGRDAITSHCLPWESIEDATLRPMPDSYGDEDFEDIVDRFMGWFPGTHVEPGSLAPAIRAPVLRRPIILA